MILGNTSRKAVAFTLLIVFSTSTFAPSISYALTSGPTQPEATSFEPVDTNEMVNLLTGDFTYNLPLIDVPGPEGGYPLSLSYHAGIQPNEDASWVGLGWTLNPGAINRFVNGFADDWYNPSASSHVYWAGGQTTTWGIGVTVGLANEGGVTAGLSFSNDTYKGFGVGMDFELTSFLGGGKNSPATASLGFGMSTDGSPYAGFGVKSGNKHAKIGIDFTADFNNDNYGFNSELDVSGLGVSLQSISNGQSSFSILGYSSHVSNENANNISTSSHGFNLDIPTPWDFSISLSHEKTRYWTDEALGVAIHGSWQTFQWGTPSNGIAQDNIAYDEYSLLEDPSYKNIVDYPDPKVVQGGSYPDFDDYEVNAQGLGGRMRPYLYQAEILNQNEKLNRSSGYVSYLYPGKYYYPPDFRFDNDFSNSFRQDYRTYSDASNASQIEIGPAPFDPSPQSGTYNAGSLVGSKQVYVGVKVHPAEALGYTGPRYTDGFDGFSITNESGVTYHFGLPAYSYAEENYQEKTGSAAAGQLAFNRETKTTPYAYTWYLTTITGPDYVDRNGNGIADDGDWGYWVNFNYGKWADNYIWRNPSEGFRTDEDNAWQNVSQGYREVYYLNSIRTRSHIALFEKEIRNDAKGESSLIFHKNGTNGDEDYSYPGGVFDNTSSSSLRLSHIYLLNASDENLVTAASGTLSPNVLDKTDFDAVGRSNILAKALKVIDFNYDYSLCANTSNSFDINSPSTKLGKLTLNSVLVRGTGGVSLIPPVSFQYDLESSDIVTQPMATLSAASGTTPAQFTCSNGNFNVGDLVNSTFPSTIYCGVITDKSYSSANNTYTYKLANCNYTGATTSATISTTKNPPYNKDAYDAWGMYKSDFSPTSIAANQNLGRMTSALSSSSVDVWSLRSITSPLGGETKVNYQSDVIAKSVIPSAYPFIMVSPSLDGAYNKIKFKINTEGYPLSTVVQEGNYGQLVMDVFYFSVGDSHVSYATNYLIDSIDTDGTIHATLTDAINPSDSGNPYFQISAGNISGNLTQVYGGGLRVSDITFINSDNSKSTTSYNYNSDNTNNISSGVTSYMPFILDAYDKASIEQKIGGTASEPGYQRLLYGRLNNLYSIARELPPPGVMYRYVTVEKSVKNPDEASSRSIEGSTKYEFEVFKNNMVGRVDIAGTSPYTTTTGRTAVLDATSNDGSMILTHNVAILKFLSSIGKVKRIVQYDANGKKIEELINHYLHDNIADLPFSDFMNQYKNLLAQAQWNYQGYIQERYSEVKDVVNQTTSPVNSLQATLSARETYPCINTGQTIIDYVNGTQTTITNLGYDYYSGALLKSVETDPYGNNILTEKTPAYTKYAAMGPKIVGNSDATKNMLTQIAETKVWKVDGNSYSSNKLGLITASVNTWSDQLSVNDPTGNSYVQNDYSGANGDVWRKQSSYTWMPTSVTTDGTTPVSGFVDFNWSSPASSDATWKNTSNVSLYNVFSKSLEVNDINGNYAATRMDYGDKKVVLTGSPAKFYEIAFSGAEDAGINGASNIFVKAADGTVSTTNAHTGKQSLLLGVSGKKGFQYTVSTNNLTAGRNYRASVWVKPATGTASTVKLQYDINGVVKGTSIPSGSSSETANGWYLINLIIKGSDIISGNTLNVYCINSDPTIQAYVDDFRFQPINATTTAYVYDPFTGQLNYVLDNNNIYTKYIYDEMGRLTNVYKEKPGTGVFQTSSYQYNYNYVTFTNDAIGQYYTKNNCSSNQQGNSIYVSIPAGTFISSVSKADANAAAQSAAQDQANAQGYCTVATTVSVSNNASIAIVIKDVNGNTVYSGTFGVGTSLLPAIKVGTYSVNVIQTNGVAHNVNISGYYTQYGTNVTFSNISFTSSLTITVN